MTSTLPASPSLYARLGGQSAVEAAVVRFYEKVMADPALAVFFDQMEGRARKVRSRPRILLERKSALAAIRRYRAGAHGG